MNDYSVNKEEEDFLEDHTGIGRGNMIDHKSGATRAIDVANTSSLASTYSMPGKYRVETEIVSILYNALSLSP